MIRQEKKETYEQKLELFRAMAQLDSKEKEIVSSRGYTKAYFLSALVPPLGIYYFFKYVFSAGRDENKTRAGIISLALTTISLLLSFWLMTPFLQKSSSTVSPEGNRMLNDIMDPEGQKELLQLLK